MSPGIPSEQTMSLLLQSSEDQLYEQLGIRAKAIAANPAAAGSYEPSVTYDGAAMGPLDDVRDFGRRLFNRWNREAWNLACSDDEGSDRKKLLEAFGGGQAAVAATLSGLLVAHFGLAPALAAIVAALALKHFFRPAYQEFCNFWQEKLPKG
jgi:hypothetical protein